MKGETGQREMGLFSGKNTFKESLELLQGALQFPFLVFLFLFLHTDLLSCKNYFDY